MSLLLAQLLLVTSISTLCSISPLRTTLIQIIPASIHHILRTVLITFLLVPISFTNTLSSLGSYATAFPLANSSLFHLHTPPTIFPVRMRTKQSVMSTSQTNSPKDVSRGRTRMMSYSAKLVIFVRLPYRSLSKLASMVHQTSTESVATYPIEALWAILSTTKSIQVNTLQLGVQPQNSPTSYVTSSHTISHHRVTPYLDALCGFNVSGHTCFIYRSKAQIRVSRLSVSFWSSCHLNAHLILDSQRTPGSPICYLGH
jgi:hypothetical protein